MKKINNIIFLLFASMTTMSCSEAWLEPEPLSFYTPDVVYNDPVAIEAIINGLKKDLKEETHNTGQAGTKQYQHIVTENAVTDLASPWSQLDFKKLTPNGSAIYNFLNMFDQMYLNIKNANVVISRAKKADYKTEADRNKAIGIGLWYRAYYYYRLVNNYGDVPFIDEEISGAKLDFYSHSRSAILNKIQADLEFAVEWLPPSAAVGDITKGAANHLLTKVYLANLEFDKAIASATAVITGPYALMTSRFGQDLNDGTKNLIWDLHRPTNVSLSANKETILATVDRPEAATNSRSLGLFTMRWYGASWWAAGVKDSDGKAGMLSVNSPQYEYLGRGNANVRPTGFYQYDLWSYKGGTWDNTTDLRRANANWQDNHEYLYDVATSKDYGKPVDKKNFDSLLDTFRFLYAVPQYKIHAPEATKGLAIVAGGNGDWYLFRLAETYLLRAEAYYWKNQLSNAAADINKVRTRAKALEITASEVNLEFIMDERARELFAEEPRHAEMLRVSFILAKQNLQGYSLANFHEKNYYYDRLMRKNPTFTQKINLNGNVADIYPYHALWPIPSAIITANTKGVINQNKGYDGAENNVAPIDNIP